MMAIRQRSMEFCWREGQKNSFVLFPPVEMLQLWSDIPLRWTGQTGWAGRSAEGSLS